MGTLHIYYNRLSVDLSDLWRQVEEHEKHLAADGPTFVCLRSGNTRQTFKVTFPDREPLIVKHWFRSHWRLLFGANADLHCCRTEERITQLAFDRGVAPYPPTAFARRGRAPWLQYLLVFPFLSGQCLLSEIMADREVEEATKIRLIHAFGETLGKIHNNNICHNDCKLDNVMLPSDFASNPCALNVIDWGKAFELADGDEEHRLAELIAVTKYVSNGVTSEQQRQAFSDGYASACSWYGGLRRQEFDVLIQEAIHGQQFHSSRRIWRNSLRKARRLRTGRFNGKRYFVFRDTDISQVQKACMGQPSDYAVRHEHRAVDIWRAANVLRARGNDFGHIVGLVVPRGGFGGTDGLVVYRSARAAFDAQELIEKARQLCQ